MQLLLRRSQTESGNKFSLWAKFESPFAKSWGGQSPTTGMNEAVEHQADRGQGDHRFGDLG
jgi:hypothetical protein